MDEFLEKEYSPSKFSIRYPANQVVEVHGKICHSKSQSAYQTLSHYSHKLSDESDEERLDIFYNRPDSFSVNDGQLNFKSRKIFIYLHGGYWQWGSVNSSSFMAENFTQKDIIVVALGYNLAPNVRILTIINQVERGVAEVLKYAADSNVYLCGHSAGAHLASCLIRSGWNEKFNVKVNNLKGFFLVSGVYDLQPILKTSVNDNLKMDINEALSASPKLSSTTCFTEEEKKNVEILLDYGEHESNEFKKQSVDFSLHLKNNLGFIRVNSNQIDSVDHFDIIENISNDAFILTKKIFKTMNVQFDEK